MQVAVAVVQYVENPLTPGKRYFDCDRLHARLSTEACSGFWRQGNQAGDCSRETCRRCPIGALHAGVLDASTSCLTGSKVCSRCHRPAARLIGGTHCVSCKNREYEFIRGRNAKGTMPVNVACLARRRLRYTVGNEPQTLVSDLTLDSHELVVAALRDGRRRVRLGMGVTHPTAVRQLRLF